ncbi:MAG: thermonuclease family protein [Nitrospinota bacterium]|nr:thermonuclease family protein [Nitrospinota bacterium]
MNTEKYLRASALILAAAFWIFPAFAPAEDGKMKGTATGVLASGSIFVRLEDGRQIRLRLHGLHTPAPHDPCSLEARQFIRDMVIGKEVYFLWRGVDRYGLTEAFLWVGEEPNQKSLGLELILRGLAIYSEERFRPFSNDTIGKYQKAEAQAKLEKKCVWRNSNRPYEE